MAKQDDRTDRARCMLTMACSPGLHGALARSPCAHDQARMRSGVKMRANAVAFTGSQADCMTLLPVYSIVA